MGASVHIAVYHELHIARLIHIQNPYNILVVKSPFIPMIFSVKSKELGKAVACGVIAKQPVFRYKSKNTAILAFHDLHISVPDTQIQLIIRKSLHIHFKDLIHGSFITQKVNPLCSVTKAVKLLYSANALSFLRIHFYKVSHLDPHSLRKKFCNVYMRIRNLFHIKISPCNLGKAAVNIHITKRGIIACVVRLQILCQIPCRFLIEGLVMEIHHKADFFSRMVLTSLDNTCIIP